MQFERITVLTRDEYRDAQEPYGFTWRDSRFEIASILDRWYEGHVDAKRMPLRYFKVRTNDSGQYILRYHELFRTWSILVPDRLTAVEHEGDS
jgi:hypothetical protein